MNQSDEASGKSSGPPKPSRLDPLTDRILTALAETAESAEIVLGGYLVLQHYTDYRTTHDIDAWWRTRASQSAEEAFRRVMQTIAAEEGSQLSERRFGDTFSLELSRGGKKYFSFQIAVRSVQLQPPQMSAWPPIRIESLADNIGAKMNALVDRGGPRDFTDVKRVVADGLATVPECWELWQRKNPDQRLEAARQKVLLHLTVIQRRRPLETIEDSGERQAAERTRLWFRRDFLGLP